MTECHIVSGLAHSPLISARELCDARCKVVFDKNYCKVYHKGVMLLHGGRDKLSEMLKLFANPEPELSKPAKIIIPYQVSRT